MGPPGAGNRAPDSERGHGWYRRSSRKPGSNNTASTTSHAFTGTCRPGGCTRRPSAGAKAAIARIGPLVVRTGQHTGRSPKDKFVVREPSSEEQDLVGQGQPAVRAGAVRRAAHAHARLPRRAASSSSRTASPAPTRRYRLPVRVITENAWHSLFARNMFIRPDGDELAAPRPEFTVIDAPSFQADPGERRHPHRDVHRPQLREAARAHRRHAVRRRDQEVDLHRDELPAAARRRAARCTARPTSAPSGDVALFFGLSGTGKTTLSADPSAHADRRRRARLERRRRLQLRGRLLRQGDPPLGRGRAGDLRDHPHASARCSRTS